MSDLDAIKRATWPLHVRAERGGIVADILGGRATRFGVALLFRNLLPVYEVLDGTRFAWPVLRRASVLRADLRLLAPEGGLAVLPEAVAYAARVADAGDGSAVAHAYVRYLGDLNGGLILQRRLEACLGGLAKGLAFHRYPAVGDMRAFAGLYRGELDRVVRGADFEAVRAEAVAAFEASVALSDAVRAAAGRGSET